MVRAIAFTFMSGAAIACLGLAACGGVTSTGRGGSTDAGGSPGTSGSPTSGGSPEKGGSPETGGTRGTGGSDGCLYQGTTYPAGSTFLASDGCNMCTCRTAGGLACTDKNCEAPCDPNAEMHRRNYIATDLESCMTIRYACPANTDGFQNACGCGCEQAATCPEYFDCAPTPDMPPCDTAMLKTQCPYSGFAF